MTRLRKKAFTLIEVLVVIGIIAALVGVLVGVLGGGGSSSTALQASQGLMSSLLSSARGQAALTGYNAAVFINNTKTVGNDRYLRYCVVAVYKPTTSGGTTYTWSPVTEGEYLPNGIFVVPHPVPSGSDVAPGTSFSNINTAAFDGNGISNLQLNSVALDSWLVVGINSLGQRVDVSSLTANATYASPPVAPTATASGNIVLSVALVQPPGSSVPIIFANANNVRGISISKYGVAGLINDASGLQ